MVTLSSETVNVLSFCDRYKSVRGGYFFKTEYTVGASGSVHVNISCDKLNHSLDLIVHGYDSDSDCNHLRDHEVEIDFFHNDDLYMYTLTDLRLTLIPMCINHEIDVILEMNGVTSGEQ